MSKLDPDKARQGNKGTPILIVLVAALALAAIVAIFMGFFGSSEPDASLEATPENAPTSQAAPSGSGETVTPEADSATQ